MKKFVAILLAAVFAVSVLAACGGNSGGGSAATAAPAGGETAAAAETTAGTAGNEDADIRQEEGGENVEKQLAEQVKKSAPGEYYTDLITIACSSGVSSWDPFTRGGGFGVSIGTFERLGQADREGNFRLQMLKSIEKVDDVTYKCELWPFVKDFDGNNITSSDVKWSVETYIAAGNMGAVPKYKDIEIIDDYNFNFIITEPFLVGEYEKQLSNFPVLSQAAYESDPDHMASRPVGTGPYKVKEYMEGSYGIYEANEDYWLNNIDDEKWLEENDYVYSYQNAKEIRCDVIADASARAIALENGAVDGCSGMNATDVANYKDNPDFTTIDIPVSPPLAFYFNLNEASLCSDVNLRKAICYAINNAGVAAGLDVPAFPVFGIHPRMYDAPENWTTGEGREYYDYNIDKAKECLAESSYNGETLTVMFTDMDQRSQGWVLIQGMLSEVGINLELKMLEMSVMQSERYDWTKWDLISDTFGGGNYLPNTVKRWYSGDVFNELNGVNICGVEDPELDKLYEDLLNVHDDASIEAWDQYFTYDNCIGYGICCFNNQTACSSKYIPATSGQQYQLCPGAFTPVDVE